MTIPAQVTQEQLAKLPAALQSEYVAVEGQDGLFRADIDGGDSGLALADVTGLQSALQKERAAAKEAVRKVKLFEGLDPEGAREALSFKERFDKGELSDEAKTRLANAEKALADKFEAQRQQLLQGHEDERTKLTQREQLIMTELRESKVSAAVRAAIATHGGNPRLLEPAITSKVKLVEEDGKFLVQVLGDNGQALLSRKSGAGTESMSIDEYVASLRDNKDYAPAFSGSGSSGGGSRPAGQGGTFSGGTITITQEQAKDPMMYRAAKKRAADAGVQLQIT